MPKCVQCNIDIPSLYALGLHFKVVHKARIFGTYQCGELNCNRIFSDWATLKKHFLKQHTVLPKITQNRTTCIVQITKPENHINSSLDSVDECMAITHRSFNDFKTYINNKTETFVAKLYNNPYIPRCSIQNIITDIKYELFDGCLSVLKDQIKDMFTAIDAKNTITSTYDIDYWFDTVKTSFDDFSSEYKVLKHFKTCGEYIPPKDYLIGHRLEGVKAIHGIELKYVPVCGQFIPLRNILQKFLELPDAYDTIISYMQSLQEDSQSVSNITQSRLWKSKIQFFPNSAIVLPLFIHYDDFEANNPLGSHCDKLGAVYCAITCLPPECQSTLNNIFLTLLFHAEDRKEFGNRRVFAPLIEELQFLETEGILVNTAQGVQRVFFILALLLGDNLGLHSMTGLVESFNSKFPCRFCKCTKRDTEMHCEQTASLLRSIETYELDIRVCNVALSGIKEPCVFNDIISFHITSNYAVDVMHDVLEGVCHYDILLILNHLHKNVASFSLHTLNFRLAMFDFGPIDVSNRPPQILEHHLKKNKLKMSASEILCFTRFFGILIGDLVPEHDKFWQLYLLLRQILDITLATVLTIDDSVVLNTVVQEHNKLYVELAGNTLKPKYHHLLHYAMVFQMSGPFVHYSSMRFEGKHRALKTCCYTNMSRKNITKSIAIKQQLKLCFRLKTRESILPQIQVGPAEFVDITLHDNYKLFENTLPALESNMCLLCNWVEYKGTRYQNGMILITDYNCSMGPIFGKITKIFISDNHPLFLCHIYNTIGYNPHIHGYEISKDCNKMVIVTHKTLANPFPIYSHTISNGEMYCILRNCM